MKKVLVFGTFDVLHEGHKYFLKEAKQKGNHLTVVVGRDSTVKKVKGFSPHQDEIARLNNLKKFGIADNVVLGSKTDPYAVLARVSPDIICLGYDQTSFVDGLKERINIEIIRLKAHNPKEFKSSIIKKKPWIYESLKYY